MDTHVEQTLPRSPLRPELRLLGEDEPISTSHTEPHDRPGVAAGRGEAAQLYNAPDPRPAAPPEAEANGSRPDAVVAEAPRSPGKRRSRLMTGAAIGVTLVAAAGVFLISPYNQVVPLNVTGLLGNSPAQPGATQHIAIPEPVAPAAKLARAPAPETLAAPERPAVVQRPQADQIQEIVNLRPTSGRREALPADGPEEDPPVVVPAPPVSAAGVDTLGARSPATAAPAPAPVLTATPGLPLVAPTPTTTANAVPASPSAASSDPVVIAATLQGGPMSTPQQIEVLGLVTQLGVLLRNQRVENAQLRQDVQQIRESLDTQLNDYARRLALAEARGAISAAMGADSPVSMAPAAPSAVTPAAFTLAPPTPPAPGTAPRTARAAVAAPAVASAAAPDATRRYRVQAASPGLAMLAEVDRTGDAGNLLQISIGDDVPGYGKVRSIAQHGAAWVLTTERGTIR